MVAITLLAFRLPVKLALVVAMVPTIVPTMLPAVILPVPEIAPDPNKILPPVILAVVVILEVEFNALITFELRLNPAAFKLPPVMLPVTLTNVPV